MKEIINSEKAPAAIGPYSHAVDTGSLIFLSGQIPLVPETGKLAEGGIEAQTHQVFANIKAILSLSGLTLDSVVKSTVFLTDLGNFQKFNAVYASYFKDSPPARSCVQVGALPGGAAVEVEVIAAKSS